HKIPITILSRCQRYDFRRITIDTISERLAELMQAENIESEEKALRYVARVADGSMRDALSLLDQCISFYLGKKLTYDNVLEVLGAVDTQVFAKMLGFIKEQNVAACIRLLEDIESLGRELGQFIIDFIWYMRNLLLIKTTEDISDMIIEVSTENLEILKQEAAKIDEQELIRFIRIFSELSNQIRYASRKRVMVEITLIKLCKPEMEQNLDSITARLKMLEQKLENGVVMSSKETPAKGIPIQAQPAQEKPVILPEALPEDLKEAAKNWKSILTQLSKKSPALGSVLQGATLSVDGNQGLQIVVTDSLDKDFVDRETHVQIIKDAIAQLLHKQVQVSVRYLDRSKEHMEEVPDLSKLIKVPIEYE
ncbi:MAG: DNA polymerase III subunit gamma/tau, partial [Herbinix sp.]|nr:DNA polymerase III subunit gamma/tau [Herbinix sp.]